MRNIQLAWKIDSITWSLCRSDTVVLDLTMTIENSRVLGNRASRNIYQTSSWLLIGFLNIRKPWPSAPRMQPAQLVSNPLRIKSQSQVHLGKQNNCLSLITSEWANYGQSPRNYGNGSLLQGTSSGNQCGSPVISTCLPKRVLIR